MRTIDAEKLHDTLFRVGGEISLNSFLVFEKLILDAPTINPNRQGKWLEINHTCGYMRTCSECGWSTDTNWMLGSLENEKFCPNCGAEMK